MGTKHRHTLQQSSSCSKLQLSIAPNSLRQSEHPSDTEHCSTGAVVQPVNMRNYPANMRNYPVNMRNYPVPGGCSHGCGDLHERRANVYCSTGTVWRPVNTGKLLCIVLQCASAVHCAHLHQGGPRPRQVAVAIGGKHRPPIPPVNTPAPGRARAERGTGCHRRQTPTPQDRAQPPRDR